MGLLSPVPTIGADYSLAPALPRLGMSPAYVSGMMKNNTLSLSAALARAARAVDLYSVGRGQWQISYPWDDLAWSRGDATPLSSRHATSYHSARRQRAEAVAALAILLVSGHSVDTSDLAGSARDIARAVLDGKVSI